MWFADRRKTGAAAQCVAILAYERVNGRADGKVLSSRDADIHDCDRGDLLEIRLPHDPSSNARVSSEGSDTSTFSKLSIKLDTA